MIAIREFDTVVLTHDLPEHGLVAGDTGTVVLLRDDDGYELEFATLGGETQAVVSLSADQVRPVNEGEIAHVRSVNRVA